ncbi:hypothetical protein [Tahibacter sp.]|uniref:hypothetical protein n=1 Tax=Tahibacter sp. TaxID=2056211 RepID=UPI0028C50204|nr:hypothetical protein [Tahibacter sp.]
MMERRALLHPVADAASRRRLACVRAASVAQNCGFTRSPEHGMTRSSTADLTGLPRHTSQMPICRITVQTDTAAASRHCRHKPWIDFAARPDKATARSSATATSFDDASQQMVRELN